MDQIVYASTAYTELKSTINQQSRRLIDFGAAPAGPADERLRVALSHLVPHEVPGAELIRVGGDHDGGYVMVHDFDVVGAISLGVGPDVSWDLDVSRRGIPVAMFDPTVRRLPAHVPNGVFHRIGVSGPRNANHSFRPLGDLVALARFPARGDLLLKIDVEGAEWVALSSLPNRDLERYRQIVVEMHNLSRLADESQAADVIATVRKLSETHLPVHLHANNYSRLLRFDQDWFPDAVEVSYLRRDLAGGAHPASCVRSPLDVPSDTRVEEIELEGVLALEPA